jgi:large subunit ribosomal protein L17
MLRALTANLVAHERIETTEAKAKELRRVAERMITRARRLGAVAYTPHDKLSLADRARRQAAQRQMARFLRRFAVVGQGAEQKKVDLVEKVFIDLAQRFKDRPGGYTRIMKLGGRRGDNAPMTLIEFVSADEGKAVSETGKQASKPVEAKPAAEPKAKEESKPKSEAKAESKPKSDAEAETKAESKPKGEAKAETKAESKPKGEAKAETKAESKPKSAKKDEK